MSCGPSGSRTSSRPTCSGCMDETGIVPDVNQIQLSPYGTRDDSRAFDAEHGIVTESWSPIGGLQRRAAQRSGDHRDRRDARQVGHPGGAALARPARAGGHPEVGQPGPDRGEPRHLRLRADRRGDGPASARSTGAMPRSPTRTRSDTDSQIRFGGGLRRARPCSVRPRCPDAGDHHARHRQPLHRAEELGQQDHRGQRGGGRLQAHQDAEDPRGDPAQRDQLEAVRDHRAKQPDGQTDQQDPRLEQSTPASTTAGGARTMAPTRLATASPEMPGQRRPVCALSRM